MDVDNGLSSAAKQNIDARIMKKKQQQQDSIHVMYHHRHPTLCPIFFIIFFFFQFIITEANAMLITQLVLNIIELKIENGRKPICEFEHSAQQ